MFFGGVFFFASQIAREKDLDCSRTLFVFGSQPNFFPHFFFAKKRAFCNVVLGMSCGLSLPMMLEWGSKITHTTQERDFRAHFGGPSIAIEVLLEAIYCLKGLPHLWSVDDLLMTLCFLKTPGENLKVSSS